MQFSQLKKRQKGFQMQLSQLKKKKKMGFKWIFSANKKKKRFSNAIFSAEHRGRADKVPWGGHPGWTVPCPLHAGKKDFELDLTFHDLFINLSNVSRLNIQILTIFTHVLYLQAMLESS